MQGRPKIQVPAIIPGGNSAPLFQFVEGTFNQVPLPVQFPVVFLTFLRFDLGGLSTSAPWSLVKASTRLLSYPLSTMTAPVSIPVSMGRAWKTSARCPPVRQKLATFLFSEKRIRYPWSLRSKRWLPTPVIGSAQRMPWNRPRRACWHGRGLYDRPEPCVIGQSSSK